MKKDVVNVAKVPQRSPFRYPGGKTWLVPMIRRWLGSLPGPPSEFIEPFAGGGIVGVSVAFENLARHVTMVELDAAVAAVWCTILNGRSEELVDRILSFELSEKTVKNVLSRAPTDLADCAFATILRNRVQRGGIMAPGASLMRYGENGRGLASRWYPETLARRIRELVAIRKRITFVHGDGMEIMSRNSGRTDVAFFIDPPYTVAGRRLYVHSEVDHQELFRLTSCLHGDFLMSYDNVEPIRKLADKFSFDREEVPMKNTHHAVMSELLIGRSLDWARH